MKFKSHSQRKAVMSKLNNKKEISVTKFEVRPKYQPFEHVKFQNKNWVVWNIKYKPINKNWLVKIRPKNKTEFGHPGIWVPQNTIK